MINLKKLQNFASMQQREQASAAAEDQHEDAANNVSPAAAALASLRGLAAGITASAAAAALNSPLNLSVGNNALTANSRPLSGNHSPNLNANHTSATNVLAAAAAVAAAASNINTKHKSLTTDNPPTSPGVGRSANKTTAANNALADVFNVSTTGPDITTSPVPQALQVPTASAQMPQLILASGQLVQGVQGAQLLIPTPQGIAVQTILTIPVSPQINTNEHFLQNYGAFATLQQQQQQQLLSTDMSLPQITQTSTNLLKPHLFSAGVQQLLATLHPELFAAQHHMQQQQQQQQQQQIHQQQQQHYREQRDQQQQHLGHLQHHHDLQHLATSTPNSPIAANTKVAAAAAAAAAFHLQQQLRIKPETQTHHGGIHHHQHHQTSEQTSNTVHTNERISPKLDIKPNFHHATESTSPPTTHSITARLQQFQQRNTNALSPKLSTSSNNNNMPTTMRDRSAEAQNMRRSPGRNNSSTSTSVSNNTNRDTINFTHEGSEHAGGSRRSSMSPPTMLTKTTAGVRNCATATSLANNNNNNDGNVANTTGSLSSLVTSTSNTVASDRSFSSALSCVAPLFRSHSPVPTHLSHLYHTHAQQAHRQHSLPSPHQRDYLGNGNANESVTTATSGVPNSSTATSANNALLNMNR